MDTLFKKNCSVEEFAAKENADFLIKESLQIINGGNPKKVVSKTLPFLEYFNKIASSVFKHEKNRKSLREINAIVIKEITGYVLKNLDIFANDLPEKSLEIEETPKELPEIPRDLSTFKNITARTITETININTESFVLNSPKEITKITLKSIKFGYISDYNLGSRSCDLTFIEHLDPVKDLISPKIEINLDPGNYSQDQLLSELSFIMTFNSKVGNNYNVIYNEVTSKLNIFCTKEPFVFEKDKSINRQILQTECGLPFFFCDSGLVRFLNLSTDTPNTSHKSKKAFLLKKCKEFKVKIIGELETEETTQDTSISLKIFEEMVTLTRDNKITFDSCNSFDVPKKFKDFTILLPNTESDSTEFEICLELEYI